MDFGLGYILHFFSIYGILKFKEEQSMQLTVDFPDSLPDLLQETKKEFEFEVKMALVAKLFQMKRISSGIAASIIGVPRTVFLLNLHKYGVPIIDLDKDELISDVKNA
jgi:predicted HTH domain antitoxin